MLTKEQIFSIADEMDAQGKNPTLAAIRKAAGGGSFTTISDVMAEWRAKKNAPTAPIREPLPQTIDIKLSEFGGELWAMALEMANNRLTEERTALDETRREMEAARQEAAELANELSRELDEAREKIERLGDDLNKAQFVKESLKIELAIAKATAVQAEKAQKERDAARDEAAELRGKLAALTQTSARKVSADEKKASTKKVNTNNTTC